MSAHFFQLKCEYIYCKRDYVSGSSLAQVCICYQESSSEIVLQAAQQYIDVLTQIDFGVIFVSNDILEVCHRDASPHLISPVVVRQLLRNPV